MESEQLCPAIVFFPQVPATIPVVVVHCSGSLVGDIRYHPGSAAHPSTAFHASVQDHLPAYLARDVLPLEVGVIPLEFVILSHALRLLLLAA